MKYNKDPAYMKIKGKFLKMGFSIPGTIRETYLLCGKKECVCATKGGAAHGPYYFWNRKVNGRLTAKSISKEKLPLYQSWISNRQEMEVFVNQVLEFCEKIAADLPQKNEKENSKKRASAKRGK